MKLQSRTIVSLLAIVASGCGGTIEVSPTGGGGAGTAGSEPSGGGGSSGGGGNSGGGGSATCAPEEIRCGDACVDPMTREDHCGACDLACAAGEFCVAGACETECGGGTAECGPDCVDLANDPKNCGQCGAECAEGEVCSLGACGVVCLGGSTLCGVRCVDVDSDPQNCGGCGLLCGAGEFCVGGDCAANCGPGTTECDGLCEDLSNDPDHCGSCDNACPDGEVCSGGTCGLVCAGGTETCGDACVDLGSNPAHCGACFNACESGPSLTGVCVGGACQAICVGGQLDCDADPENGCEASILSDPMNCGACGLACAPGQTCEAGVCEGGELGGNLLLCGTSQRDVSAFIPPNADLTVVASCTPDENTQAMLISRSGQGAYDPNVVRAYVSGGGRVLTETFVTSPVYADLFQENAPYGAFLGACTDRIPTVVQLSPGDRMWQDQPFVAIPQNDSGCGNDIAGFPGLVPLAGWAGGGVSIGYRDLGQGRVWATEFDWQDTDTTGPVYGYTNQLMGYMITTPLGAQNLDGMFASFESEGRTVGLWQTPPCADLSQFETFCEERGLSWWAPRSPGDAQTLINFAFNLDNWHTWIQTYGSVNSDMAGALNGMAVTVDGPNCVASSAEGWSAFRRWACSFCDPETNGQNQSCCWDTGHAYDWFACEF